MLKLEAHRLMTMTTDEMMRCDSFQAGENEIAVILGDARSGKETLLRRLSEAGKPSDGEIRILDDETGKDYPLLQGQVLFSGTRPGLSPRMTVREHLLFACTVRGMSRNAALLNADRMLERMGLNELADETPGHLSSADKKLLSVLMSATDAGLLCLLSNPTEGLPADRRGALWRFLREYRRGRILVITSHYIEEAQTLADRLHIMCLGQMMYQGTVDGALETAGKSNLLEAYLHFYQRRVSA